MASRLLRFIVPILLGAVSFGLTRLLRGGIWLSVLVGAAVTCVGLVSSALDLIKKTLEVRKLKYEVAALKHQAKVDRVSQADKARLVQPATPDEVSKFGVSILERRINIYRQVEEETERLESKEFITRLRETKRK